jgi:hypothetical protein
MLIAGVPALRILAAAGSLAHFAPAHANCLLALRAVAILQNGHDFTTLVSVSRIQWELL